MNDNTSLCEFFLRGNCNKLFLRQSQTYLIVKLF